MTYTQQDILETIPKHLRQFVVEQNYEQYSPEDHALWRFIMRLQRAHLDEKAHEVYLEGLEKTGISTDHVPSIEEMNRCLSELGWRAVVIDGYIPTAAFMEFHSHRIMPIAVDMRTIDHVLYTPAPDIVHEAAGHAPFLVDVDYNEYLQKFGEYGVKAIFNKEDMETYEAVRKLSIVKEDPASSEQDFVDAENELNETIEKSKYTSESSLLGRLYWWTVEYGLVGTVTDYQIFGAGLLSSLGEGRSCLDDKTVKKIPYTLDSSTQSFDITKEQPQLFVVQNCLHMTQVLEEFADRMCFRMGGAFSMRKALEARIVATCEYTSGLQVSGQIKSVMTNAVEREIYFNTVGPTQLAYKSKELPGHDISYHSEGFGSPVGGIKGINRPLEDLAVDDLKLYNIVVGEHLRLEFLSGIVVEGVLENIVRRDKKNLIFTFDDCIVKDVKGTILFDPSWGKYDMAVGRRIVSVYAGSADREKFDTYPPKSSRPMFKKTFTEEQRESFKLYTQIRDVRESGKVTAQILDELYKAIQSFKTNWLLRIELLELIGDASDSLFKKLAGELENIKKDKPELASYFDEAIALI